MPRNRHKKYPVLDLHGYTTDEIFNLMDQHITKYSHSPKVKIIVGKGTGAVKKKAVEYLKLGNYPWKYETIYGKINEGCLIVELN
ncbi:MAG: Smr/MutS family protein [Bdellovibrionales bacterium]|nr:Smr/MutS family protein [Bdellovibrionales bacterium]